MFRSRRPLACLILAFAAALGSAAPAPTPGAAPAADAPPPDWFEVELIVFRQTGPDQAATETWPDAPGRPAVDIALELEPTANDAIPFMALPPEKSRMVKEWDALKKSSRFEPLAYIAWLQPPFERGAAPLVRIASPAAPAPDPALVASEPAAPAFGAVTATTVDALPPIPALPPLRIPLDGTATLGLQRYLYLTLDLVLLPADLPANPTASPEGTTFGGFRLTETRRMRSKELHYFDHPLFGAVALITPRAAPGAHPAAGARTP